MTLTQDNRTLRIETRLGENVLILTGITINESISAPFSYWLDLVSERSDIAADEIVGTNVTFSMRLSAAEERFFNGQVNAFMQAHAAQNDNAERSTYGYRAEIVPWFVSLSRTSNCRIFQNKSVPEIIEEIFTDRGLRDFELQLNASYSPREYCVQYRESDYDFIVRLMAYEGIFYFFTHENGSNRMIIGDSAEAFQPCPGRETTRFVPTAATGVSEDEVITELQEAAAPPSGRYVVNDYNFETPNADLSSQEDSVCSMGQACDEIYDYPAVYTTKADGERIARIRIQQQEVSAKTVSGASYCRPFACGYQFTLADHPNESMNVAYLLTEVSGSFSEPAGGTGDAAPDRYENQFSCIPMEVPYRPPLINTKPMVQGIQSAFVVGPDGEEIYTDEYGRIKIQFHWDRLGQKDENSSCYVRVAQSLAGPGFGTVFLPRIGQEVIVSFLEGDPDRPVVTGCLYNAGNMPPYELPTHRNISTVKTQSTPDDNGYNELRFDDSAGNEQIFLHAQGSRDTIVRGSHRETVGGHQHTTVKGNHIKKVDGGLVVNVGEHYVSDVTGIYCQGSQEDMTLRSYGSVDIGSLGGEVNIASRDAMVLWGSAITLKVNDSNWIVISSMGIEIQGDNVWINGGPLGANTHHWNEFRQGIDPQEASSGRPPQESGEDACRPDPTPAPSMDISSTELPDASGAEPDMVFTEEEVFGQGSGSGERATAASEAVERTPSGNQQQPQRPAPGGEGPASASDIADRAQATQSQAVPEGNPVETPSQASQAAQSAEEAVERETPVSGGGGSVDPEAPTEDELLP